MTLCATNETHNSSLEDSLVLDDSGSTGVGGLAGRFEDERDSNQILNLFEGATQYIRTPINPSHASECSYKE